MIPDVHIEPAEFGRPLGRERVDALRCDAINVVIEECPWIVFIQWVQPLARFRVGQRGGCGLLHVIVELSLNVHVRVRAGARHVAANKSVPVHLSNFFYLREITRDILGQCESAPWHPTGKHHVDDHQDSLRRRVDENVSRLVRIAVVGKFEHLIPDPQRILVRKSNRGQRPIRICIALIVRLKVSDRGEGKPPTSYLIVSKIDYIDACVTDIVKPGKSQNASAQRLADAASTRPCKKTE
ncbi:MAG: hypothetical protein QOE96_3941 [Blastocatellia bacterium]|nr:hypothetical protein [Blastocatellia bacterium]